MYRTPPTFLKISELNFCKENLSRVLFLYTQRSSLCLNMAWHANFFKTLSTFWHTKQAYFMPKLIYQSKIWKNQTKYETSYVRLRVVSPGVGLRQEHVTSGARGHVPRALTLQKPGICEDLPIYFFFIRELKRLDGSPKPCIVQNRWNHCARSLSLFLSPWKICDVIKIKIKFVSLPVELRKKKMFCTLAFHF